jgi:dihydroorotate dehydrogenase (NAD+) catalytic subunit
MADLRVNYLGVEFKNPVITASGTFGFGFEYNQFYDLSRLGGICVKGLTLNERQGNPAPRIFETAGGVLNSVGLQNPGVRHFVKNIMPVLRKTDTRVVANVAGSSYAEYSEACKIVDDGGVDIIELNVSCPNVSMGGSAFGTNEKDLYEVVSLVKKNINTPLAVKLSPNVTDIALMAKTAADAGADGISLINTLTGMAVNINTKKPFFKNVVAGLSGPCVKPVALRMAHQVRQKCKNIPIIGMGGIENASDALEFLLVGASLVAVGTANFKNPLAPIEIIDGINEYLDKNGITDVNSIIGGLCL